FSPSGGYLRLPLSNWAAREDSKEKTASARAGPLATKAAAMSSPGSAVLAFSRSRTKSWNRGSSRTVDSASARSANVSAMAASVSSPSAARRASAKVSFTGPHASCPPIAFQPDSPAASWTQRTPTLAQCADRTAARSDHTPSTMGVDATATTSPAPVATASREPRSLAPALASEKNCADDANQRSGLAFPPPLSNAAWLLSPSESDTATFGFFALNESTASRQSASASLEHNRSMVLPLAWPPEDVESTGDVEDPAFRRERRATPPPIKATATTRASRRDRTRPSWQTRRVVSGV